MMDEFHNENDENIIVEINKDVEDTLFDEDRVVLNENETELKVAPKKKVKKPKKHFWHNLSKKQKIIFIVVICLICLIVAGLLVYFLVLKKKDKPTEPVENVVVEKDNYIYENGTLKFLDDTDKVIGTYECQNKNEKKCYVAYFSNEDENDMPIYLDEKGNKLERRSSIYEGKYAFVNDGDVIYLRDFDANDNYGEYELVKNNNIEKTLFALKNKDKKYGILEIKDGKINEVLEFKYDYLEIQNSNSVFVAKSSERSFLVDSSGKELTSKINGTIRNFSGSFLAVYDDGYELLDYSSKLALPNKYEYIDFIDGYTFAFDNKKAYVFNVYLDKLNEEGIKVKTNEYQKKYIFDSNNNLLETKKAYDITISDGHVIIKSDNNEKSINIYEALLNKNIPYVSYLDSTLYFYSDEDKENLIGSYKCINKNTVYGPNDEYKNCFIAKDSNIINNVEKLGYIPIINNNYVFISDNKSSSEKNTIRLYDLKNSKQISEYQLVDTGISEEKITFVSVLNNYVYAQNTSGGYGVITFGPNGPSGVISFNDKGTDGKEATGKTLSISLLKDYFYVKRENKNLLYDKAGNEIARSNFEIIDYIDKYILVKDKNYLVYGTDGSIISGDGKYISLKEKYFVLIDSNNKFNIYSYKDGKKGILQKELVINNTEYSKAYEINETDDNYIITIINSDNTKKNYLFDKTGKEIIENNKEGEENEG